MTSRPINTSPTINIIPSTNMITRLIPLTRLAAVIGLASMIAIPVHAQLSFVEWTGASDSNYLNSANWSSGVVPGSLSDIQLPNKPEARKSINLAYTGTGDATYQIWGMQTGARSVYTMTLSGTERGWLIYDIVGRGAHPTYSKIEDSQTFTNTGNSNTRLPFNLILGPYSKLTFDGSTAIAGSGKSNGLTTGQGGLAQADIAMLGNSEMDLSRVASLPYVYASANITSLMDLEIGGLQMEADTKVYLGMKGMSVEGQNLAGMTHVWAGHIYSDAANVRQSYKYGVGTTLMTGRVDMAGIFNLRGGRYLVDGVHNGPITGFSGAALLGGSGTINWMPAAVAGVTAPAVIMTTNTTLTPGDKGLAGRLTINGNVVNNGILSFDLIDATHFDQLIINGDLKLGPAATGANTSLLAVGMADSFPLQPGTYRVMTVSGDITGTFSSVSLPISQGLKADYRPILNAGSPDYLDIIFTQLAFGDNDQLSGNHLILAKHIDAAVLRDAVPGPLLDSLNRQPSIILFRNALDQLSPATFYSWYPSAVVRANAMVQTVEDRLDQRPARTKGSWETYGTTYRQESSIGRTSVGDYSNFDAVSVFGGVDYSLAPSVVVGGLIDYTSTDSDLDTFRSTSTTDSYTGGLYVQAHHGDWVAQILGFVGQDEYKASRNVAMTKLGTWATSDTEGTRYGASVYLGHTTKFPWVEVTPNVGFHALDWSADRFTEKGAGAASLTVASQNETSLASLVGVRVSQSYTTKRGFIRPYVNLRWQREFNNGKRTMKADLFGERFAVKVPGIQPNGLRLDAGFDWSMLESTTLQIRYALEQGGAADESLGIRGGLNVAF